MTVNVAVSGEMRPPATVMRLARMGSFFPTRLSFMRSLLRRLAAEQAAVSRPVWDIDSEGYGRAVYSVDLGGRTYSLAAFSNYLDPDARTDRVIAEAWDTSYTLFDGVPSTEDLDRLAENVARQEAGRYEATELVLSRANKSLRLFNHVVDSLAAGRQPDAEMLGTVGYLMRTTAVYGNGKFGISDRVRLLARAGFSDPFQAELLTVWLIRGFTHDLVEHVARCRAPDSWVPLDRRIKRHLGIGNSTGLGMAPFIVSHPSLLHRWMHAREAALARVSAMPDIDASASAELKRLASRARRHLAEWDVEDTAQMAGIIELREDFGELAANLDDLLASPHPIRRLLDEASGKCLECQELVVSLALEPFGGIVDDLAGEMASEDAESLDPAMSVGELREIVARRYDWAMGIDFSSRAATGRFWYASEEKLEPRLGERHEEPGAELEMPLDIARRAQALSQALRGLAADMSVAEFLLEHPEHRAAARRAQTVNRYPYGEIQDNLIGADLVPVDMLRCKLSFFGASKFDVKSDRWTRITLFQGAPLFDDLAAADVDDWWLPATNAGG